mgnify:CR=1 FL=1
MDPVLLTTFGTLIILLIFTVPIGVSIGTAVFMGMMVGGLPPVFLAQKMYSALDSFPLLAVPLFIIAGDIMQKGTIANSLLAVSHCLVGHIKGGMAHISILTSLFYGALSGSAAATVAAVGGIMIPAMEKEGYPPLRIFGSALQGGEISLAGGVSSQYISALLMIAPLMENGLTLHLEGNIISRPYINLTLQLMEQFGVKATWNGQTIKILPQEYKPIRFTVESDWSAASYWYAIMALSKNAEIELLGLFKNSLQGDAAGAKLFAQLGVGTAFTGRGVVLKYNGNAVKKLIYNFDNEPDLAQTFVVTCVLLNIPFRFTGLQSLKIKETDRIEALKTELRKLGYLLTDSNDSILEWNGERCEPEADPIIATYEDHRMAMAFAPAALVLPKGLKVADPEVVTKSYPAYWEDLRKAGFALIEN